MKFAVLYSIKDEAGKNIAEQLRKEYLPHVQIVEMKKESIYEENIDKKIDADFLIFATKHASAAGKASLSVHAPGNWKQADYGGKQGKLCPTSALFIKHIFKILEKNAKKEKLDENYEITLEVTHHGPFISKPCLFIEIGSNEREWKDKHAGKTIAKTIAEAINSKPEKAKPCIGLGGPHYCPNFNKIQLNSEYAISHIIPEYALPLTKSMIEEALEKTEESVDLVLLDWKGLGKSEQRQEILDLLKKLSLDFKRTSEIEK